MKSKLIFILMFLLLPLITAEYNQSLAEDCLNNSQKIILELKENSFSTNRIEDVFGTINNIYSGQLLLKEKGSRYDFSIIESYCLQVEEIKVNAYMAKDEYDALMKFYNNTFFGENYDTVSVDEIISQIENEIGTERYEKVVPLVDLAYEEIVNIQSRESSVKAFYDNTANKIKNFFINYWIHVSVSIILLFFIFLIFRKIIVKKSILNKIDKLNLKKEVLRNIIQKTQKEYFQNGKISENEFSIKTKKLAELIRDIDRQIPLLIEELALLDRKKRVERKKRHRKRR